MPLAPWRGVPFDPPAPVAQTPNQYLWLDGTVRDGTGPNANIIIASAPELLHTNIVASLIYKLTSVLGTDKAVQSSLTVAGHALTSNVTITASDVGAPSGIGISTGTNTGDQTITLTGGVTGSGTGSFAATVQTNANLTGPITSTGNATAIASQTGTGTTFVMSVGPTTTGTTTAQRTNSSQTLPIAKWTDESGNAFLTVNADDSVIATDNFTRADSPSSLGSAVAGGAWTAQNGTWGIQTNKAYTTTPSQQNVATLGAIATGDGLLSMTLSTTGDGGPVFRFTNTSNYFYYSNSSGKLGQFKAGAESALVTTSGGSNGDVIAVELLGPNINIYRNGTLLISYATAFNQSATIHGMRFFDGTSRASAWSFTKRANISAVRPISAVAIAANTISTAYLAVTGGLEVANLTPTGYIAMVSGQAILFNGVGDNNWRIGKDFASPPTNNNLTNALQIEVFSNATQGFQIHNGSTVWMDLIGSNGIARFYGWSQQVSGRKRNTADVTNATATMANLTDLTMTLIAGRKYTGRCVLIANNSVGAEGLQFDFNGGGATFSAFRATAEETPIGATLGVTDSSALGTAITNTVVATSGVVYAINLTMVCANAGTFIPRFSEVSHTTGTATVSLGSYLWLEDTP